MQDSTTCTYTCAAHFVAHAKPQLAILENLVDLNEKTPEMLQSDRDFIIQDLAEKKYRAADFDLQVVQRGGFVRREVKIMVAFAGMTSQVSKLVAQTQTNIQVVFTQERFHADDVLLSSSEWDKLKQARRTCHMLLFT